MTDRPTSAAARELERIAIPQSPADSSPEIELAEVELDADPWGEGLLAAADAAAARVDPSPSVAGPQWAPSVWQTPAVDEVGRHARQRQAMHAATLLALGVALIAVLVSAAPAFGRALGPGRSVAALRGIARATRAAGWAQAPIEPPAAGEAKARPAERGGLPGFDPLGGAERGSALVDPFDDRREGARPSPPGADGQRDDSGAALRLGVLREPAKIRAKPEADGSELGELPASELVVVASRSGEWLLVAGTTERHNLVGWTERENVIVQ